MLVLLRGQSLLHRGRRALHHPGNVPEPRSLVGHSPALLNLLRGQGGRLADAASLAPGPGLSVPDPLAGGVHLVGARASMARRKYLPEAMESRVSMLSRMATMPMSRSIRSAWMRTPSSKLRLNRSRKATAMVSPGRTTSIRSCQPERSWERPVATSR